jgi:hypothetical protein
VSLTKIQPLARSPPFACCKFIEIAVSTRNNVSLLARNPMCTIDKLSNDDSKM